MQPLFEALRRPEAFPVPAERIEVIETHVSMLFFAGDRVYKVKKPVDLGFLDATTLERRRFFCEEELRLNRRLAPDVYLRVVPIARNDAGGVVVDGEGEPIEHAVEMVRLPAHRMLDRLLEKGEVDNALMGALATRLARFHAEVPTGEGVDDFGTPDAVLAIVLENFEQTRAFVGPLDAGRSTDDGEPRAFTPRLHGFLERAGRKAVDGRAELLAARVRTGRIREGHGDLHAGNICVRGESGEGGSLAIYDCLEFAPRFRCGDVAADLGFLAMDLDLLGYRAFSEFLARSYGSAAGDAELEDLLRLYKPYRAMVRAKVGCLRARELAPASEERERARRDALRHVLLAAAYELPPALILTCGLPGTGKSWLARHLARPFEAAVLRSDVRRRHVEGGQGYGEDAKQRTYDSLLEQTRLHLDDGRTVVVDATFSTRRRRERFVREARRRGCPLMVAHVRCDEAVVLERLARRAEDPDEVSEADAAVYRKVRARFEPPEELEPDEVLELVSGEAAGEEQAERLVERLVERSEASSG